MSSQKEVVIIGGGVIGCSIAYHLAKQGVPSQIIEMDGIAARASGKSWAIWQYPPKFLVMESQPYSTPKGAVRPWIELFWLGYHRLPEVALDLKENGGIDIGYGELPWISVAFSENGEKNYKESLALLRSEGYYEGSWLEADDLKAIFPGIHPEARGGRLLTSLQAEPYQYTLGLAQAAEKMGASIRQGEIVGFNHKGSKVTSVIFASGREVEADVFILAMGPWSGQGTASLGKEIPIWVHREQCLRVEVPQRLPNYWLEAETGGTIIPKANGTVILGHIGRPDPQPGFDNSPTEKVKVEMMEMAVNLLPSLADAKLVEHRSDLEGWAPPHNQTQPVLGRLPEWDNAYIAARMATYGMMMSLGVGRVMTDLILGGGHRVKNMMEFLSPAKL